MTFLPIVDRELRVAARHGGTYWMRWAAALAALVGALWLYALTYREAPKQAGQILFVALSALANVYALLAGVRTTADCLSEEKREGTLGLLFLTDLRGYDIVLGKLAATSLNAFYGLLAMFPVLGISIMMGGVTFGEFGRVVLVSVNNLLFSLAVGMFCSAVSRDDRKAMGATLLILLLAAGLPVMGPLIDSFLNRGDMDHPAFLLPSPSFTCFAAFDATFTGQHYANAFWASAALVHSFTWLLLALATWIVPRTWQERAAEGGRLGLSSRWRQWQYGSPEARAERRQRLLEVNPILWLTSRERFKVAFVFAPLICLVMFWVWGDAGTTQRDWRETAAIPFALCAHAILKMWLSGEASRRFSQDRRTGALEMLLAAPLSVDEILHGQRLALWRQFAGPTVLVLLGDLVLMACGFSYFRPEEDVWALVWLAGMVMLVWDLHALSWVSPWMGLNSRSPNRASSAALVRICILPWLVFAALFALYGIWEVFGGFRYRGSGRGIVHLFILAWVAVGAAANVGFGGWAKRRLMSEFRAIATRRFDAAPRHGEWGRVLGEWLRGKR